MMMKRRLAQTIVVFSLFCLATPLYAATPWLHTDGNVIKDPCGNIVILRGIDLIDLGFLQDWEGGAIAMVDRLTNQSDPCGSSPGWYPRVLRINITPPDSVSYGWPHPFDPNNTDLYSLLRSVVDYCKTKNLYAIIDWHYVDNTYSHVASTNQFWTYMAPKFANDSHVIFELFNEPINTSFGSDNANWLSVRTDMQNWFNLVRSYAPNNLVLVAGASWSQTIGPAATYPLTGDNIAIVSHIYPYHWLNGTPGSNWYTTNINNCLARYPVFMSEWGFYNDPNDYLGYGSITNYGQPLQNFREARNISNSAWVSSYDWTPTMFTDGLVYKLRIGPYEMGGFVKDTLYLMMNANQPSDGNTIPPAAPTGLTATPSTGTVTLDWNNNTDGDLYGYDIYRSTTPGGETTRLNLVRSKTSAYTDTNVAGTRTYYYVVTAVDTNFNSSADSIEVSATVPADSTPPAAPSGLSATAGDANVLLVWNNNTEPDFNGYNVYRSTISGGPYTRQNGALFSSPNFIDGNVTNGTIYYYVVTAVDTSLNESADSSQVSARPQTNPIVGIISSWVTGTTNTSASGYNRALVFVAHAKASSSSSSLTAVTYGGQAMTKITDKLTGSSTSRAYVAAFILNDANINAATNTTFVPTWTSSPSSTNITYTSVFLQHVNQTTPVGATASAGVTSSATVSTSALTTNNGDMVIENAASSIIGTYTVTSGWTKDVDLSVTGYDGMDGHKPATGASETPSITQTSGNHSLIGFVVKMAPNVAPAAPTGLSAASSVGTVSLDWNTNTEIDLAGYNVYRSTTSGSGYVELNSALLTSSNYTDTNVVNGTTYYYVVTAVDTSGLESVNSSEVSATPINPASGTGSILREWWNDVPGSDIEDLLDDADYPDNPSGRQLVTKLEGPLNWGNNNGSRFLGYITPVISGSYTFWIASDDMGFLLLSTNDDPANLGPIAYTLDPTDWEAWDTYPSQLSGPISLVAGQKYYFEVLHKEQDTGNGNVSVAWEGPGINRQVIDGVYLSPCSLEFVDFAGFAGQWGQINCNADNNWCSGADFDRDGTVDIEDLISFADGWLVGNNPLY
ncbi:MAG: cellulase family glycosylhydrolase [Sedimentisphaerales bacterium]|jgi:fibronectin type 3 domain-containing protein